MQIAIPARQTHRPATARARLWSLLLGISLVGLSAGTAVAVVGGPAAPGFDRNGPAISQTLGSAPLTLPNGAPGDSTTSHTTIVYRGDGPGAVRLTGVVTGDLAPFLAVTIVQDGRADATRDGTLVYDGTLAALPADWTSGLSDGRTWQSGEQHTYRITVTLMDDAAAQGGTAGATFRWESRPAGA